VRVIEHKVKNHAGIGMMCALKVANIPTICIDGKISFVSIIPDGATISAAVKDAMIRKGL
jgi:hypothetical protein